MQASRASRLLYLVKMGRHRTQNWPIQRSSFMAEPATGPRTSTQLASPELGRLLQEDFRSSNKAGSASKRTKLQSQKMKIIRFSMLAKGPPSNLRATSKPT